MTTTAAGLRDAVVRCLLASDARGERHAWLLEHGPHATLLQLAGGEPLVLVDLPDEPEKEMTERLRHVAAATQGNRRHVVLVGGGDRERERVADADLDPLVDRHHVDDEGRLWSRDGALQLLAHAARAAVRGVRRPLDPDELAEARRGLEAVVRAESGLARQLERRPRVTQAIVVVCIALFGLELALGSAYAAEIRLGAVSGLLVREGQWWRLVAGTFLHGSLLHLGANMWSLWSLGRFLEPLLGRARFMVLYAASGLAGALCVTTLHPEAVSVGASGAIFGMLGALAGLAFGRRGGLPATTRARLRSGLWQPLLVNAGLSLMPGIDALSHLGGGLAGLLLTGSGLVGRSVEGATVREAAWRLAAGVCLVVTLSGIAAGLVHGLG